MKKFGFIFFIVLVSSKGSGLSNHSNNPKISFAGQSLTMDTYCNARFGYCVDYPSKIAIPHPESENGDGRIFTNKKGEEILRVWGRLSVKAPGDGFYSLKEQYQNDIHDIISQKGVITYRKFNKKYFVLSGYAYFETANNHKVWKAFYQKTFKKHHTFCYAVLQYDTHAQRMFNTLSNKVYTTFRLTNYWITE
jgi:hypothetical protein